MQWFNGVYKVSTGLNISAKSMQQYGRYLKLEEEKGEEKSLPIK